MLHCKKRRRRGETGKTTIILELMLDVFICRFFPARLGEEERFMIATQPCAN